MDSRKKITFSLTRTLNVTIILVKDFFRSLEWMVPQKERTMDIKKTTDSSNLAQLESAQRKRPTEIAESPSRSTEVSPDKPKVDTGQTVSLVELGKRESKELHQRMIDRLRQDIANGTYTADLNVVAERVAEVLGTE
jgi:anti-sigma28 factor (negative regulator of flagellin synthesis)